MDFMLNLSDSDIAFIIVFYIYMLCASVVSFVLVSIYTKIETGKSFKKIWSEM